MISRSVFVLTSLASLTLLARCGGEPSEGEATDDSTTGNGAGTMGAGPTSGGESTSTTGNASGTTGQNTTSTSASSVGGSSTSTTQTSGGTVNGTGGAGATVTTTTQGTTGQGGGQATSVGTDSTTTGGPDVDQNGKPNAAPGDSTDVPQDYVRLGEIRILNNNWGSEDLGCTAPTSTMSVFVNESGAFGWNFNRGDCAQPMDSSHPDFPQVEFGIHPFGIGSDLETSPPFSSTTVLPLQIKDITSSSITLDQLNIALQNQSSWNLAMEFWLSERHPVNDPNPGVYAEIMAWWGWQNGRWPCDVNPADSVQAGAMQYTLCHQDDNWSNGQWRYYQFRAGDGSDANIRTSFNGTIDIKAFLDYLVNSRGYSPELWVTRLEVGSEIDDNTSGTVSMNGITFEVNGQMRSEVIGTQ